MKWLRLARLSEPTPRRSDVLALSQGPVPDGLRDWSDGLLEEVFPDSQGVEVELEELLLEALDHPDPLRRKAALECLRALIKQDSRWGQAGPGRPIEVAHELAGDQDPGVREAARAIVRADGCAEND